MDSGIYANFSQCSILLLVPERIPPPSSEELTLHLCVVSEMGLQLSELCPLSTL